VPLAVCQLSLVVEKSLPFHQLPPAIRSETSTWSRPTASDAVPAGSFQPAALYEPPAAGNVNAEAGAVRSIVHERDAGDASVLPAVSVARTSNVCKPSARPV
jgi:hypothetical protein